MTERVAYGNVQAPRYARTMGLSMASVAVVIVGAVTTFLLMQFAGVPIVYAAIALVAAAAGVWFLESGRKQGRTRLERAVSRHMFRRAKKKGASTYISGPTSRMPDGSHRAPGLLASTEMLEGVDHLGRPFAFLWDRIKRTGTVFFTAAASGLDLQDQETVDYLVSAWGGYLDHTGTLATLEQVSVTVTSTRDTGERLPAAVEEHRAHAGAEVPAFARDAVNDIVDAVNANMGRVDARIAVTFTALANGDAGLDARDSGALMGEVMVHLPAMIEQLELSGGGVVSYLAAQEIIDSTYVAYNPESAVAVERARLSGQGTGLSWEEVGPVHAVNDVERGRYVHGGGFSQSFQVWKAPAGVFHENSLVALLRPDEISEQKRVTILYRPLTMDQSQKRVETAVADADYETNQKGRKATGAQLASAGRARRMQDEVSQRGASLVRFSFVITVTVMDASLLPRVPEMVRNAASTGAQLGVRPATGNEDAAFAIGLGLGIVPAKHATISPQLIQAL